MGDNPCKIARSMEIDIQADIAAIGRIPAVKSILEVVCRTTGMGFAAVARVTEDRWVVCDVRDEISFGLKPGGELKVETTICNEIRQSGTAVIIDHVAESNEFSRHPTPQMYGFQSYISVPITLADGRFFGTLCSIDPRPARVNTPEIAGMFHLFAQLIAFHLDAQERLSASERTLLDERRTSELREQFIAVLGHDLRNPLASIDGGATLLAKTPMSDQSRTILALMRSSVGRMSALIDNVLDFARGRMGGGLTVSRRAVDLGPVLDHVVAELRTGEADGRIDTDFSLAEPVDCDPDRVAQLASNLISNAQTHGAPQSPIRVVARSDAAGFEFSVANAGEPIAEAALERLFKPFERGAVSPGQRGLGLGLYIASEIARAHGGILSATSTAEETRFTFRMPVSR
jgi:signal transduction histidine kinase